MKVDSMKEFEDPDDAITVLSQCLETVGTETGSPTAGRVLAQPVLADRDSPAIDVSAMDGYAVRMSDLSAGEIRVSGEVQPGEPPVRLPEGTALRVFTGAAIPLGTEAVVMREDVDESSREFIRPLERALQLSPGANIRRQGENGKSADQILDSGTLLNPASIAAAANFGAAQVTMHRPVRVTIIVTGNELLDASDRPEPWQLRDSNGPTLAAVCATRRWIECREPTRCIDSADTLASQLADALASSDAVILTGGVSKGDYDHVPGVISRLGARTIFHRLPIRPGRPILGAASPNGQLILGLPGNPVSAAVGMVKFGLPLLAKQSGQTQWLPVPREVTVTGSSNKTLPLHWYRLVQLTGPASAQWIASQGSGDLVSLAHSSGFVHLPPMATGSGPFHYYGW